MWLRRLKPKNNFYPRPPRGERPSIVKWRYIILRISIHALREESDRRPPSLAISPMYDFYPRPPRGERLAKVIVPPTRSRNFYPRPPRGERQQKQRENTLLLSHYTPLCTNCKEMLTKQTAKSHQILGAVQRARPWSGSCCPTGRTADCPRQGRSGRSALL